MNNDMSFPSCLETTIDFIANLPKYAREKPYFVHPALSQDHPELSDEGELSNVEWDAHTVSLRSIRHASHLRFEEAGFCFVNHESDSLNVAGAFPTARYMEELEDLLRASLNAKYVKCIDFKKRANFDDYVETVDENDQLHVESVAKGAHAMSLDAVTEEILAHLSEVQQEQYLNEDHRFRIIRTWRPINRVLEHRPLAVCDFTSVDPEDLIPTDRVWPSGVQEVHYLKYNQAQRWYWLPSQKSSEPLIILCYDSHAGDGARYCPHAPVENPQARLDAAQRESIDTRMLVINSL